MHIGPLPRASDDIGDTEVKKQTRPIAYETYISVILTGKKTKFALRSVIIAVEKNMPGLEDWWWGVAEHICHFVGQDVS